MWDTNTHLGLISDNQLQREGGSLLELSDPGTSVMAGGALLATITRLRLFPRITISSLNVSPAFPACLSPVKSASNLNTLLLLTKLCKWEQKAPAASQLRSPWELFPASKYTEPA